MLMEQIVKHLRVEIADMHCNACVSKVHEALAARAGVRVQTVEVGRADVDFDEEQASSRELIEAIRSAGFGVRGFKVT